jgi:hypothetical protein
MNRREWVFAIIVLVAAAVVVLVTLGTSVNPSYPKTVSTTNSTLGLMFSVTLNTTQLHSGQTLNITAYETNLRPTLNNLTFAFNWGEPWLIGWLTTQTCGAFANAQVYHGFYTSSNISAVYGDNSSAGPLQLAQPLPYTLHCPGGYGPWERFFPFQSHEVHVGYQFSASGYYPPRASPAIHAKDFYPFRSFELGVYTISAGDCWGQLVIAHFSVN